MKVVLDTNEFIFALRDKEYFALNVLKLAGINYTCIIPEMILEEVFQKFKFLKGKNFASKIRYFITNMDITILPDEIVNQYLIEKYRRKGAKGADAFIAAFAEFIGADYIVSENRDFLKEIKFEKIKVCKAEEFLKILRGK